MKQLFTCCLFLLLPLSGWTQDIKQPEENKAMVYFVRRVGALLVNFKLFDGEQFIGTIKSGKFIAYECAPGEHAFIAKSENKDFLDANLEAGKVYIVEVEARMGYFVAQVKFAPLDKNASKYEKRKDRMFKVIGKNKGEEISSEIETDTEADLPNETAETTETTEDNPPSKTLERFKKLKEQNKVTILSPEMYIELDNAPQR